jgi:pilus assembly protein CpaB
MTSLVFALLAMLLVYFYVSEREASIKKTYGTEVTVVVATKDINEFTQITSDMLATKTVPSTFAMPRAEKLSINDILSSGSVAAAPIAAGEQLMPSKLLVKGAETGLASQVAITRRAISIQVDEVTGVTKLVKPGDRVDIVSMVNYQGPTGQMQEVKTVMQDVNILSVGEVIQNQVPSVFEEDPLSGSRRAVNMRGNRNFSTITVEVTPADAQKLILLAEMGSRLYLTLRNPVDREVAVSLSTTTVDKVLGEDSEKFRLSRPPPAPPPVLRAPAAAAPKPVVNPFSMGGGSLFPSTGGPK